MIVLKELVPSIPNIFSWKQDLNKYYNIHMQSLSQ